MDVDKTKNNILDKYNNRNQVGYGAQNQSAMYSQSRVNYYTRLDTTDVTLDQALCDNNEIMKVLCPMKKHHAS